jgi:2-dehydropantoate 2-reductase
MRKAFARRLASEIMTEVVHVARAEGVRLEKVAGTINLDWLAIPENRKAGRREDFFFEIGRSTAF